MTGVSTCRRTSLIDIRMTGMTELLLCLLYTSDVCSVYSSILQYNGRLWAAPGRKVRGEEAKQALRVERSHSEPGVEDGGGLQTEAQVLLHEPLWEIQSQGSQTMETDVTNIKNCDHHSAGTTPISLVLVVVLVRCILCLKCLFCFCSSLLQLVSFGLSNEMMVTFKDDNLMTFRHLFLKGYKDHRLGSYDLYTKADVYDHIYYVIDRVPRFKANFMAKKSYRTRKKSFTLPSKSFFSSTSISKTWQ